MNGRHYRTRRNRLLAYPFSILMTILGLIVATAPRGGLLLPMAGGAMIIFAVVFTRWVSRVGIEVGQDGIVVYGPFMTRRVRWSKVAGLATHRWSINQVVDVKLSDGRTLNTNLIQGAPVIWNGGRTKDILSVLQAEFDSRGVIPEQLSSVAR